MTWSKYHKNCVITGPLDGFCLVCDNHLKNEDDLNIHLEKPIHKKNLEATLYYEKFKDEHIRKLKNGYYCEFCNLLFFTASKVGLHVAEAPHRYNKGLKLLKRINGTVLAFDNVLIDEMAWNGFEDKKDGVRTCFVCDIEFENESIHKTEHSHVLNLIQQHLEFGDDKSVYRKIDESSYQCLICNSLMNLEKFSGHINDDHHKDNLKKSLAKGLEIINQKSANNIHTPTAANESIKNGGNENVSQPKKDTNVTAKQTETNKKKDNATHETHIKKSYEKTMRDSGHRIKCGKEMDNYLCNVFGAKDYITRNLEGKSMCLLCDWSMDEQNVLSHIKGRHHLYILKLHKARLEKMASKEDLVPNKNDDKGKILDSLPEFQKNDITINFEIGMASCKKCSTDLSLEFNAIQNHIDEHKKKGNKKEPKSLPHGCNDKIKENGNTTLYTKPVVAKKDAQSRGSSVTRDDEQIESFTRKNNLVYTNGKVSCQLCDANLSSSLKCLKQHVNGFLHKSRTKNSDATASPYSSANLRKVPMNVFVTSLANVRTLLINDIIVNDKYNLNAWSFSMVSTMNGRNRCELCDVALEPNDLDVHNLSPHHLRTINEVLVVASLEDEFVREPRPGVYHCGYCGKVELGWEKLMEHIVSTSHRETRRSAEWRLREHSTELARRREQRLEQNLLGFLMNRSLRRDDSSDDEW